MNADHHYTGGADASGSAAALHDHDFLGRDHDQNAKRTLWVVALTAVMMVGEIVAGLITGSMALLADGIHMATHAGARHPWSTSLPGALGACWIRRLRRRC